MKNRIYSQIDKNKESTCNWLQRQGEEVGALSKLLGKLLDNTNHKSTRNWTVDSWLPKLPTVLLSPRQGQGVSNVITIVVTISHFFFLSITVTMSYIPIPIYLTTPSRFTAIVMHTSYFSILERHWII